MNREQRLENKKAQIKEIKEHIEQSDGLILVDYRGLNVDEVNELRGKYREFGIDYKVYKNSMMRFAFEEAGHEEFGEFLTGPNAIAFGKDGPVDVAKVTYDFAKDNKKLEIKAAMVDGNVIPLEQVEHLAKLPPKEVLLGQVVGGLNAPISGLANVLQGTIRNLAYVLNAVKEKQEETA